MPRPEEPLKDDDLLARFREGDEAALTTVYRAYVKDVANLIRHGFTLDRGKGGRVLGILQHEEHVELVQEVFLRAFGEKARQRYDQSFPYRPYLLRIAKNLMIDRLRKSGREVLLGDDEDGSQLDALIEKNQPISSTTEDDVDGKRLEEATQGFLKTVDAEQLKFMQLRFVDGVSQADVAKELGVTRRWVRTQEGRAREALRDYLTENGLIGAVFERVGLDPPDAAHVAAGAVGAGGATLPRSTP